MNWFNKILCYFNLHSFTYSLHKRWVKTLELEEYRCFTRKCQHCPLRQGSLGGQWKNVEWED